MRLWIDVSDAAGTRLGAGPVANVTSASITRKLDGVGALSVETPLTDPEALRLLDNERRIALWYEIDGQQRQIGRGIVRGRVLAESNRRALRIDAVDEMDELKRVNTLLARIYTQQAASSIAADLVGLVPGWTVSASGGGLLTARFDGASVLKALQELCEGQGLHLRAGLTPRSIEIGAFGAAAGVRIVQPELAVPGGGGDEVAYIESIELEQSSEAVANWIVPVGQGEGEAALTLARSTRTTPYPIQTTMVNGRLHHFISDGASVAAFGQIQRVMTFKQIGAISNSDADLTNAANALYDAAAAWLARNAQRLETYNVRLRKVRRTIRPGDRVRLAYRGRVQLVDGRTATYIDVDADFWVIEARESFGLSGVVTTLKLANIDRVAQDEAAIIVGALEAINIRELRVQTYPSTRSYVYVRQIAPGFPAAIPVEITNATTALNRARLRIVTRAFRVNATAAASGGGAAVTSAAGGAITTTAAAGGNHRHRIASHAGGPSSASVEHRFNFGRVDPLNPTPNVIFLGMGTGSLTEDLYTFDASGTHTHDITIASHTHNVSLPAHTHALTYGINDDTVNPTTVSVWINGVDRTAELGGPWAGGGAAINIVLDITPYLVNAAGGLRQAHTVEVRCASGRGEVEATVELYETVQGIAVT